MLMFDIERKFEKIDAKITTTTDRDSNHETALLISQQPGETTTHAELTNVPPDHISPAKPGHYSLQSYSSSISQSPDELPKTSSTTPHDFSAHTSHRAKFDAVSPVMLSPRSPFSPIYIPPSHSRGYNSLPDDEHDHDLPAKP